MYYELPVGRKKVFRYSNRPTIILGRGWEWLIGKYVLVKIIVLDEEENKS